MRSYAGQLTGPPALRAPAVARPTSRAVSLADMWQSTGQPLDTSIRAAMERRLGHDFSRVRVHTDARAGASADALQARAYTVGQDIVFGRGEYAPTTAPGAHLLAHELTHVAQQRRATDGARGVLAISEPDAATEPEADQAALAVTRAGATQVPIQTASDVHVARQTYRPGRRPFVTPFFRGRGRPYAWRASF